MGLVPASFKPVKLDFSPPYSQAQTVFNQANDGDIFSMVGYSTAHAKTITDTSEPTLWDYEYVVKAEDIPRGLEGYFQLTRFNFNLLGSCLNNDIVARTITSKFGLNDSLESDTVSNICNAGFYNNHSCIQSNSITELMEDWKIVEGDKIQFKVWADVAGVVDLVYNMVEIFPSKLIALGNYRSQNRNQILQPVLPAQALADGVASNHTALSLNRGLKGDSNWAPFAEFYDYDNVLKGEELHALDYWGHFSSDVATKEAYTISFYGFKNLVGGK